MIRVTVDIFSGRPNPTWVLDGKETELVIKEITKKRKVVAGATSGYQGLGYRGALLELLSDDMAETYELPSSFMIANGAADDETGGLEIATMLVKGMLKHAKEGTEKLLTPLDKGMQEMILKQMSRFHKELSKIPKKKVRMSMEEFAKVKVQPKTACCYYEVCTFNPGFWNDDPNVMANNNCYNYAVNCRTNTFAQPGRASGDYPYSLNCTNVTNAALSDGAHKRYDCFPDSEKPRWLMAMVIWPGYDYHWYRKALEGFWGHKPGGTPAKNTDNSGNIIMDPQTCDRGPYTDFCEYFYSCKSMTIR